MLLTAAKRVRWLLPGCVVAVMLLFGVPLLAHATGGVRLPARTAGQLVADLRTAHVDGLSGTLLERADLGLNNLPDGSDGDDGDNSALFSSLVAGSHMLRLWYADATHVRLTLLGALGESDIIRNGDDLWIWSSTGNAASHLTVPAPDSASTSATWPAPQGSTLTPGSSLTPGSTLTPGSSLTPGSMLTPGNALTLPGNPLTPSAMPLTPFDMTGALLGALDQSTTMATAADETVAGRAAYQLIVTPHDSGSLISQISVAIDGEWHIPLRVAVYAAGATKPDFEVGFTEVNVARPDAAEFQFNPPPDVTVTQVTTRRGGGTATAAARPTIIGSGWTAVLVTRTPGLPLTGPVTGVGTGRPDGTGPLALGALVATLPEMRGSWGHGRLLSTRLFSALFSDDGRIFVGAVTPGVVLRAAART